MSRGPHKPSRSMIIDEAAITRFWSKVLRTPSCWLWLGGRTKRGYGAYFNDNTQMLAYRFAFIVSRGSVPEGMVLDHLCRVKHCVNPDHLEAVTQRVNVLRGDAPAAINARRTHCSEGHELSDANTYESSRRRGWRICRPCARRRARLYCQKAYNGGNGD